MRYKNKLFLVATCAGIALGITACIQNTTTKGSQTFSLIHTGDIHGHLMPRPNLRSDGDGRMEGGLARMFKEIKKIRDDNPKGNTFLINSGDTIQGSGEALYTKGQALVDVLDMFSIDAYVPGNWDFVYGPARFNELFVDNTDPANPRAKRWGGIVSNLYATDPAAPVLGEVVTAAQYDAYTDWYVTNGKRILPPYTVKTVGNAKVGVIGCTTTRGPQVVGKWVTEGLSFTDCAREVPIFAKKLRTVDMVDLVVLVTEIEIGRNIQLIQNTIDEVDEHIDVILNTDMHEETLKPIEVLDKVGNKTLIVEEGQDGTMIGEFKIKMDKGKVTSTTFIPHRIHDGIKEDWKVADKVAQVHAPFASGFTPNTHQNPFNDTYLKGSLDDVVGSTAIGLHRSNFSDENMPAVIEGTSHDWIADAIRWWAKSDLATVRGFRYGTHVKPGPITRNDIFHLVPIGPRVAKASRITGNQIRNQIDNSSLSVFSNDPSNPTINASPSGVQGWGGGWLFAYSGDQFGFSFDPYYEQLNVGAALNTTSRSRGLTVRAPCDRIPPADQTQPSCVIGDLAYTGYGMTTLNTMTDGKWTPTWSTLYSVARPVFHLIPNGWTYVNGTPGALTPATRPFQYPAFSVGGYWYAQSPDTINNCNNCFPLGTTNDVNSAEAPYLLPVNVNPATGTAMLDENDNPIYKRDTAGVVLRDAQNRPLVDGDPIDLTEILEKYLAAVGPANPVQNRITLLSPLPARSAFGGIPIMQPLCGTVLVTAPEKAVCP